MTVERARRSRTLGRVVAMAFTATGLFAACIPAARVAGPAAGVFGARNDPFLDTLEQRTFQFFWDRSNAQNGLTPDRWPTPSFSSIAAVGFALTAYPIAVERGYITRDQAEHRVLTTLRFFWAAPQGPAATGMAGYHGFFYHFIDMQTGARFKDVELSTIDTALLLAGVLFCREYFTGSDPTDVAIRAYADSLNDRVDWRWAQNGTAGVSMGWTPEAGFSRENWRGYNEAMILYILALGARTHPAVGDAWGVFTAPYRWGEWQGQSYLAFGPLFGHQYSHIWVDFRGIQDAYMRAHGADYFENSRRATYAHRTYAINNPMGWKGYGADFWGVTASDGPADTTMTIAGRSRTFHGYAGRGVEISGALDDGTLAPTGAAGSVAFAPEIAIPALKAMRRTYGDDLFSTYGFLDAFNPTLTPDVGLRATQGRIRPLGWFDTDYLGIDQGPIIAMVENFRTELVWRYMRKNAQIRHGLERAGFTGGWLDTPAR